MIGVSGSLIWSKTQMELIFNHFGEFRWRPEDPVSQIHSPLLYVDAPGIFPDPLRPVQMLKREWSAESNGKLSHLFNPWWNCSFGSWVLRWKTCLRQPRSCACSEGPDLAGEHSNVDINNSKLSPPDPLAFPFFPSHKHNTYQLFR